MDWTVVPIYVALGAFVGFLAGLLGIGGGFTIVPVLSEVFAHEGFGSAHLLPLAIGTSAATIVFTAFSSARAHHLRGAVDWNIVLPMAPGLAVGALIGPQIASVLPMRVLAAIVGIITWFAAIRMLTSRPPQTTHALPGRSVLFAVGAGIGTIAGMVGTAGAFLSVPFMVRYNVKVHTAVATSAAIGWPVSVVATLSFVLAGLRQSGLPPYSIGYVYLPAVIGIAAASILLAPLGAHVAHTWPVARLRRAFSTLLFVLGAFMLWKAFRA
jgi:uncharacterized membrane protein YfcA